MLLINVIRHQVLVLTPDRIIIRSRFNERTVERKAIRRIDLRRERRKPNDGTFAVVRVHLVGSRRKLRFRMANYEREQELTEAFRAMRQSLPTSRSGGRA